jgi:hypothetical protein
MNGEYTLRNHLLADSSVTSLLTLKGSAPALAVGVKEPTKWKPTDSTISIYNAGGMDNRDKRMIVTLTANCRGATEVICKQIASAVVSSVNREQIPGGGRYYCQTGFVIPPQDDLDSYNLPVEITMKAGEVLE